MCSRGRSVSGRERKTVLGSEYVIQTPGETHKAVFLECAECDFWMAGDDSQATKVALHFHGEYHRMTTNHQSIRLRQVDCPEFKLREGEVIEVINADHKRKD